MNSISQFNNKEIKLKEISLQIAQPFPDSHRTARILPEEGFLNPTQIKKNTLQKFSIQIMLYCIFPDDVIDF